MPSTESAERRVVITGLGLISPIGNTKETVWQSLRSGQSGVAPFTTLPENCLPTSYGAEARCFRGDIQDFGNLEGDLKKSVRKGLKVMCRECQMGVAAAVRALDHAGLKPEMADPERSGVVFGSDYMLTEPQEFNAGIEICVDPEGEFDLARWGEEGMRRLTPLWLLKYLPNMPACHVAIYYDLQGPNNSLTLREASSMLAVGEAFRSIARGSAETMIVGATGTRVHAMRTLQIVQQEEVAPDGIEPTAASRPFDRDRKGMVLGEGAGAIVLEELETAKARGATILGEVIGASSSSVADRNFVAMRGQALLNSLRATLRESKIAPAELGHVNAHGLGTRSCDAEEAWALGQALGDASTKVPVTALKSYFGNLGAASGMIELIASLLTFEQNELFPTLNYEHPDPECAVNVASQWGTSPGDTFVKLNVTPQGQAACVAVRRFAG